MKPSKPELRGMELEKLPPSIVFGTAGTVEFLRDGSVEESAHRAVLEQLVESAESIARMSPRELVAPSHPEMVPADQVSALVARVDAFISLIEHGALEQDIRTKAPQLLARYTLARDGAVRGLRLVHAFLVAGLGNAWGAASGETLETRLDRALHLSRCAEPVDLGDFSQYAAEE